MKITGKYHKYLLIVYRGQEYRGIWLKIDDIQDLSIPDIIIEEISQEDIIQVI